MRTRRWPLALLLGTLVLATSVPTGWTAPADDAPTATQVVVRGKKVFSEALEAAARPAWAGSAPRPVLLVFDVTPFTRKGRAAIEEGLAVLDREAQGVPSWSVAALGGKVSKPAASPVALGTRLAKVLAKDTEVVSTLTALSKTLKSWREKNGVVVYVADWHFEDDVDLEGFIQSLKKKEHTLSVVGTEAAFRRGWNDGLRDLSERFENDVRGLGLKDYWEGVGRDPFGGRNKKAPWHGGDTAYPLAPYRWHTTRWKSAFQATEWDLAEEDESIPGLDGFGEMVDNTERLAEIAKKLARIEEQLANPGLGDEVRRELQEQHEALEAESERLLDESLESLGGEFAEAAKRARHLAELQAKRTEVNDRLGTLLEKMLEADGPDEEAQLEGEHAKLEAERDRLTEEIDTLEAELAEPEPHDAVPGLPFPPDGGPLDPEDLKGRLPPGTVPGDEERPEWIDTDDVVRKFPLPSSFGPYGLMRATGVTGGRYVLFSWNPSGRKTVVYEYSRCNLFPPDLRSRKAILKDLRANPWARSSLEAWWSLVDARVDLLQQLPPVRENMRSPNRMDRTQDVIYLPSSWESMGDQKQCVRVAAQAVAALDRALEILDAGLAAGGEPKTTLDQRHHAEALLFRHAARVARFEFRETIAVAKDVPRSAFRKKGEKPGVSDEPWVRRGRNPEKIRTWGQAKPRDIDEGMAIIEERKALLERFRGTPFGEQLAMNTVDTCHPVAWEVADTVPDTGRSPSESTDLPRPSPPPPGGGSGGGGPSTGGG